MARRVLFSFALVAALLAGDLGAWPVPLDPVAWTPPRPPALAGLYASNRRLASVEWLGRGHLGSLSREALGRIAAP